MALRLVALLWLFPNLVFASTGDIRVRVDQQKASVVIIGENLKLKTTAGTLGLSSPTTIELDGNTWKVNNTSFSDTSLSVVGSNLKLGTVDVPELLHLARSAIVGIDVIAELPVENYLLDVVASEVPSSWPLETLKAQAVAARSYALYLKNERRAGAFHVDSTTQDQVFNYKRHLKIPNSSVVVNAVRSTAHQVLADANGAVIKAFFHAHCGGEGEDAGAVWPEYQRDPNFKRMKDDSCALTGAWTAVISEQQILDLLGVSRLISLVIRYNKNSERVEFVDLRYEKNGTEVLLSLTSQDFRRTFGYTKVRSTIFKIVRVGATFELSGRGFGHGVGMCQTGSRWMGAGGEPYTNILSRYYSGTKLTVLP